MKSILTEGYTSLNVGTIVPIYSGACAVSGARTFMDFDKIEKEGLISVTKQVKKFIDIIAESLEKCKNTKTRFRKSFVKPFTRQYKGKNPLRKYGKCHWQKINIKN